MTRPSLRVRLTLVYGGLFFAAGILLIALTYTLVAQRIPHGDKLIVSGTGPKLDPAPDPEPTFMVGSLNRVIAQTGDDALDALLTQGGIALLLVGAVAVAFGWLLAGRVLHPLNRVTETAGRIARSADRGLHERIGLRGPRDEVKELADTFDAMLEHLDRAFDSQRRFIANASHELRTPLTLNRALLEVAVYREPASPQVRQLGLALLEINARNERLIDGLLLLARAEREPLERSYVDLADIAEHVVHQTPRDGVDVQVAAAEAATAGNPVLLERLVQNLVDNGIRHNVEEGGWVRVETRRVDGYAEVAVTNTGPVVPPYEVPALFEPFRRLGRERLSAAGAGLGLSIVQAIARAHGGEARAEARPGGGLVVTVRAPAAEARSLGGLDRG
ncbi:HAMP domain-containing sensor histidine kinase [Actinokineospora auranticolor]|uniref:histidine kinase n=1 Tax=Actinokineospora auranticolor TaxID=155976 RepID=A0A2S6H1H5_9PSEU|nr:HAMP domain-containing sensor histidine kinase [Actinokineospora auranticolor]PPK71348.1 signal transduction histidine kinase [Actinokineospora auranticolor]